MATGASGNHIVAFGQIVVAITGVGEPSGSQVFTVKYKLSEPVINGGDFDVEHEGDLPKTLSFQLTDSEVEAELRSAIADYCTARYGDTFVEADIRGCKV